MLPGVLHLEQQGLGWELLTLASGEEHGPPGGTGGQRGVILTSQG